MSRETLVQKIGAAQAKAVQEALKPLLSKAGVHTVEKRIGKPRRFFSNTRQRGTMKVRDFLAVCAALDLDPGEFIASAISGEIAPEIRRPRIVAAAWAQIREEGPGLGDEQLSALDKQVYEQPRQTRSVLVPALQEAQPHEVPRILGLYGSALRIESDLDRAEIVFKESLEIARDLDLPAAEPGILLRMAFLDLERERPANALKWAQEATLGFVHLNDVEGQGRGFQALGMIRYYSGDYQHALRDLDTALRYLTDCPELQLATHQVAALCYAESGAETEALNRASRARTFVESAPVWMQGKLSWLEARLTYGATRLRHLRTAQRMLCPARPADCALLTVEMIEESLKLPGQDSRVEQEVLGLCALLEKTGNPRIEKAIMRLVRHHSKLAPRLMGEIRRSLDRAQNRRLSTLVSADLGR